MRGSVADLRRHSCPECLVERSSLDFVRAIRARKSVGAILTILGATQDGTAVAVAFIAFESLCSVDVGIAITFIAVLIVVQ